MAHIQWQHLSQQDTLILHYHRVGKPTPLTLALQDCAVMPPPYCPSVDHNANQALVLFLSA